MLPWMLATVADAVIVDPLKPKETLFELENTTSGRFALLAPADTVMLPTMSGATDAVSVDPLSPKVMPLPSAKVSAERLLLVAPAEMFTAVSEDATDAVAVIFDPSKPKLTLFEFANVTADTFELERPALTLIAVSELAAGATDAVNVLPFRPNDTPLLFEKMTVPDVAVWAPAAMPLGAVDWL